MDIDEWFPWARRLRQASGGPGRCRRPHNAPCQTIQAQKAAWVINEVCTSPLRTLQLHLVHLIRSALGWPLAHKHGRAGVSHWDDRQKANKTQHPGALKRLTTWGLWGLDICLVSRLRGNICKTKKQAAFVFVLKK